MPKDEKNLLTFWKVILLAVPSLKMSAVQQVTFPISAVPPGSLLNFDSTVHIHGSLLKKHLDFGYAMYWQNWFPL